MPMKNFAKLILLWGLIAMEASADNLYFTATGEEDGNPLIFRSLHSIPSGVEEADYPYLISIYWPYQSQGKGMPNAETNDSQILFEDSLVHLDKLGISHLMLVVTGNGRKEWHWYAADVEHWMQLFNKALTDQPVFPIDIENSKQPNWSLYHNFVSGVEGI